MPTATTSKSSRAYRTTKFILLVMSKIPVPSIPACLKPARTPPPPPPPMSRAAKRRSLQPEFLPERREATIRPERRQSAKRKSLPPTPRPVSMVTSVPSEKTIIE
ncbi:hypothetical protein CKM354_001131400 [Cercospora kikuchii]|uniref:Uncharacterized protein n=1 Tax=Cercospora kikuchii TaxID=84275 RepID=A0A9P3CTD1_9PEZI|nr:uncharacterized protein CKM354_001131400 [Cercospora kikuchii]GIZ48246.1 hypothetical protein CKM354_001131400 [Cercospora kikuchii]